jgi:RNA polymerase sigma-70 factor (ECF subfamily)
LPNPDTLARFEEAVLPHQDAAYNLARWLTRHDQDAEDLVQEAYLRAFKSFGSFYGVNARAWLLTIVRNTCYTWLGRNRARELSSSLEDSGQDVTSKAPDPQALLLQGEDTRLVKQALEELPVEFREALVLRHLEGLSYKEIADIAGIPQGTVMSRLARAHRRLKQLLSSHMGQES